MGPLIEVDNIDDIICQSRGKAAAVDKWEKASRWTANNRDGTALNSFICFSHLYHCKLIKDLSLEALSTGASE